MLYLVAKELGPKLKRNHTHLRKLYFRHLAFGCTLGSKKVRKTESQGRKKKKKQGRQNEGGLEFEERKAEMITSEPRPTAAEYCMKSILRGIMVIKRIANRTVPTINQSNH
jgi:hypothetical protein